MCSCVQFLSVFDANMLCSISTKPPANSLAASLGEVDKLWAALAQHVIQGAKHALNSIETVESEALLNCEDPKRSSPDSPCTKCPKQKKRVKAQIK